ncbi:MAG: DUF4412 domain-containing protein [Acidobacteriia bacterium]|jgi:hypothetical protein|nr:DUF4412 domain-containing protein [Terriglobia bacterium]
MKFCARLLTGFAIVLLCSFMLSPHSAVQGQSLSAKGAETSLKQSSEPTRDLKVVTAYTQGAQVFQNTTYIKGARQRVEFPGMVSLVQCDLHRTVILNPAAKRYMIQAHAANPQASPGQAAQAAPQSSLESSLAGGQAPRGGVVTWLTTFTDTRERQQMFGLEARRIRAVTIKQVDANACDKTPIRIETDGWYVDLPQSAFACKKPDALPEQTEPSGKECHDRVEMRVEGQAVLGFPVKTVTTTVIGEGDKQETFTSTAEVTFLEVTTLDASLFEIPSDYAAASGATELIPAMAQGASLEDALFGSTADGKAMAAPKKPGVIRIGVLEPINRSTRTVNTRMLWLDLVGKFSKAPYEALRLSGTSAADIEAEANRLGCDYILLAEITEVKTSKGGGFGGFLKAASGGGPPKDVHEVKAGYRLFATGATSAPRLTGEVKASSGGKFGFDSALQMASFGMQMYSSFSMMRAMKGFGGMGLFPGMNLLGGFGSFGGVGGIGQSYFDPSSMAMNSIMGLAAGGGLGGAPVEPSQAEVHQTVSSAFDSLAKAVTAKLGPAKPK